MPVSTKPSRKKHLPSRSIPRRPNKRSLDKPHSGKNARKSIVRSLDHLDLSSASLPTASRLLTAKRKTRQKSPPKPKPKENGGAASSGDEYTGNFLDTYIGQIGACAALGKTPADVINLTVWERFTEEERDSLLAHLPQPLSHSEKQQTARMLVSGADTYFGSPRDRIFDAVAVGLTHPRVRRWRHRVSLLERRHHLMSMKEYHNRSIRRLLAWKACDEHPGDVMAQLSTMGRNPTSTDGSLQALQGRLQTNTEATLLSDVKGHWDVDRWQRVMDFRIQETERSKVPKKAFRYINPWGQSIVGPLKRGVALDGGRPREHVLLRNERPSHVTILCIVRDAASRLQHNRGTRADICDLLRDSQYVREGTTAAQLNTVVSRALDRLHNEEKAPVRYNADSKEWCYLHNDMNEEDFGRPVWAGVISRRQSSAVESITTAKARGKPKSQKERKAS